MKRVFFMGSGPSIAMGLPSVTDLTAEAIAMMRKTHPSNRYIGKLLEIMAKVFPNSNEKDINFEELLTVLDDSNIAPEIYKFLRTYKDTDQSQFGLKDIYKALVKAAVVYLWNVSSDANKWDKEIVDRKFKKIGYVDRTIEIRNSWFKEFNKLKPLDLNGNGDSVITTNYDILVEQNLKCGFCYPVKQLGKVLVLKLHGSINWYEVDHGFDLSSEDNAEEILAFSKETKLISANYHLKDGNHTINDMVEPLIVPPFANKRYDHGIFRQMFYQAARTLLEAEELIILGYSFSDYDYFVKQLVDFALNSNDTKIRRVYHYDNSSKPIVIVGGNEQVKNPILKERLNKPHYQPHKVDFRIQVPNFDQPEFVNDISVV
jgi:hypothetical protein